MHQNAEWLCFIILLFFSTACATSQYFGEKNIDALQAEINIISQQYPALSAGLCRFVDRTTEFVVECGEYESPSGSIERRVTDSEVLDCRRGQECQHYERPKVSFRKASNIVLVEKSQNYEFFECNSAVATGIVPTPKVMLLKDAVEFMRVSEKRCARYTNPQVNQACLTCLDKIQKGEAKLTPDNELQYIGRKRDALGKLI